MDHFHYHNRVLHCDEVPVPLTYTPTESVFCFFRTHYSPKEPPPA